MNSRHLPSPAATKVASRPMLYQLPGRATLKWKTLLSFGWKLIGICRGLVLLYAILTLTHEAIDRGVIQLFGYLTNQVSISSPINLRTRPAEAGDLTATEQKSAKPPADETSVEIKSSSRRLVETYFGWMILAICGVGFSIPLHWVTTKIG